MTGAERQRQCRKRRRRGLAVLRVTIEHDPLVLALLETGRIRESAALDRGEVEKACSQVLADFARRWEAK
jgi:hypothetical protein